jgi:hypothetical protein
VAEPPGLLATGRADQQDRNEWYPGPESHGTKSLSDH